MPSESPKNTVKVLRTIGLREWLCAKQIPAVFRFFLLFATQLLEKQTGKNLFIPVRSTRAYIARDPFRVESALSVAKLLKSAGILDRIHKNVRAHPDEPKRISFRAISPRSTPNTGHGVDFFSEEAALWRAIGESTERFLWRYYDFFSSTQIRDSHANIQATALDIFSLAGFSNKQKDENSELRFSADTTFLWTEARSLITNKRILCPVQLVSSRYMKEMVQIPFTNSNTPTKKEPMLRWCISTGLAAGQTKNAALLAGLLEIIERDAFMITHLNKLSPPVINLTELRRRESHVDDVLARFERYNLEPTVILLPTDFPVFVYAAVVSDRSGVGPAITVGASATFNADGILDALGEALSVRLAIRRQNSSKFDPSNIDQEGRLLYWARPEYAERLHFLTAGKKTVLPKTATEEFAGAAEETQNKQRLALLTETFRDQEQEVCFVDLTSPAVKKAGLHVVNVVAPKMHPMHLHETLPYWESERLQTVPRKLGFSAAHSLNTDPHPFP